MFEAKARRHREVAVHVYGRLQKGRERVGVRVAIEHGQAGLVAVLEDLALIAEEVTVREVVELVADAGLDILPHAAEEGPVGQLGPHLGTRLTVGPEPTEHHAFGDEDVVAHLRRHETVIGLGRILALEVLIAVAPMIETVKPRRDRRRFVQVVVVHHLQLRHVCIVGVESRAGIEAALAMLDLIEEQAFGLARQLALEVGLVVVVALLGSGRPRRSGPS